MKAALACRVPGMLPDGICVLLRTACMRIFQARTHAHPHTRTRTHAPTCICALTQAKKIKAARQAGAPSKLAPWRSDRRKSAGETEDLCPSALTQPSTGSSIPAVAADGARPGGASAFAQLRTGGRNLQQGGDVHSARVPERTRRSGGVVRGHNGGLLRESSARGEARPLSCNLFGVGGGPSPTASGAPHRLSRQWDAECSPGTGADEGGRGGAHLPDPARGCSDASSADACSAVHDKALGGWQGAGMCGQARSLTGQEPPDSQECTPGSPPSGAMYSSLEDGALPSVCLSEARTAETGACADQRSHASSSPALSDSLGSSCQHACQHPVSASSSCERSYEHPVSAHHAAGDSPAAHAAHASLPTQSSATAPDGGPGWDARGGLPDAAAGTSTCSPTEPGVGGESQDRTASRSGERMSASSSAEAYVTQTPGEALVQCRQAGQSADSSLPGPCQSPMRQKDSDVEGAGRAGEGDVAGHCPAPQGAGGLCVSVPV